MMRSPVAAESLKLGGARQTRASGEAQAHILRHGKVDHDPKPGRSSGLGVPFEVNLDALGKKALATALPTAGKNRATVSGRHARPKTELLFARAFGGLIGAFHRP